MSKLIRIDSLKTGDKKSCSTNGDGVRIVVWFAGCDIRCEGCHNHEYWNFDNPIFEDFNDKHINIIEGEMDRFPLYSGISVLGGEPFSKHNIDSCLKLCAWFREKYPQKTIWIWSGHTYEWLLEQGSEYGSKIKDLLNLCDILVDGPFIASRRNIKLKFRGSDNQRIINIKEKF